MKIWLGLIGFVLIFIEPKCGDAASLNRNTTNSSIKQINGSNKTVTDNKGIQSESRPGNTYKREAGVPDALVDDPEEFVETAEIFGDELPSEVLEDVGNSIFDRDSKEYSYSSDDAGNTFSSTLLSRSKRQVNVDPRFVKLLEYLAESGYFDSSQRKTERWNNDDSEEPDDVNALLRLINKDPVVSDYRPEQYEMGNMPESRFLLPVHRRIVL